MRTDEQPTASARDDASAARVRMLRDMLKLMRGLGFVIKPFADDPDFKLVTHAL